MSSSVQKPRTSITQAGVVFFVIAMLVQMAGITTGENLLYLLVGSVVSLLVLSFLVTRLTLRGVHAYRDAPESVERGANFKSTVRIENRKRFLPLVSINLSGGTVEGEKARHIGSIAPRDSLPLWLGHNIARRGLYRMPPVTLESGFPLGLFRSSRRLEDRKEVLVTPRIRRLRPAAFEQFEGYGDRTRQSLGEGDEFFSLRDYIPGDDVRRIAWRVSARLGHPVVRELEPMVARDVRIFFDTRVPLSLKDGEPLPGYVDDDFELAVDVTASLAVAFLERQYSVSVVTLDEVVPRGEGSAHGKKILRMLALTKARSRSNEQWPSRADCEGVAVAVVSADPALWGHRGSSQQRVVNPFEVSHA